VQPRQNAFDHLRETRFPVSKITFIVTPPFSKGLKNQADLYRHRSKNARIHAAWPKFQNSPPTAGSGSVTKVDTPTFVTHQRPAHAEREPRRTIACLGAEDHIAKQLRRLTANGAVATCSFVTYGRPVPSPDFRPMVSPRPERLGPRRCGSRRERQPADQRQAVGLRHVVGRQSVDPLLAGVLTSQWMAVAGLIPFPISQK
jgi:hypothetical protein